MTLINSYKITRVGGRNRRYVTEIIELKCDFCDIIYICPVKYKVRARNSKLHFCSIQCRDSSSKNGKLRESLQTEMIKKYGSFYVETPEFKNSQINACLQKYGVTNRLKSKEILDKIKQTNTKKYGRNTFVGSKSHQSKMDYNEVARKAWITKIANGTCSKSKIEERVYDILSKYFGEASIIRQVPIIRQWIDFYIKPIDLYLQVDGIYWHGLNRPVEEISLQKTAQDKRIFKQIFTDAKLNEHMLKSNKKLLRITDEQIKYMSDEDIINYIKDFNYARIRTSL